MRWQSSIKQTRKPKLGGAGSGSLNKGDKGPIKTILIGYKIVDIVLFQAIGDPVPANHSPFTGKSRTSDPKVN
jgi:hypothetical protein